MKTKPATVVATVASSAAIYSLISFSGASTLEYHTQRSCPALEPSVVQKLLSSETEKATSMKPVESPVGEKFEELCVDLRDDAKRKKKHALAAALGAFALAAAAFMGRTGIDMAVEMGRFSDRERY